jgi:hypothetical protein
MAITIDTMRERIVQHKINDEYLDFGDSGTIYWVSYAEDWLLLEIDEQGQKSWSFDSLEDLVDRISDEDIEEFYQSEVADEYDDEDEDELEDA